MTYFAIVCFIWAAVGIGSRLGMAALGNRWNSWETGKAYREKRPFWVVLVAIAGFALIAYTWYRVFTDDVPLSWIIAVLISLTAVKGGMFLFRYEQFRAFVVGILQDKRRMMQLNISVVILSVVLILMGIFLY